MDEIIRIKIESRLRPRGFIDYSFDEVMHKSPAGGSVIHIDAHNEFWYFFDVSQADDDFTVSADNRVITKDKFSSNGVSFLSAELTGNIIIDNTGAVSAQDFLFFRIIPK